MNLINKVRGIFSRLSGRSPWLARIVILLVLLGGGFFAGRAGLEFRGWMWDVTASIRVTADLDRDYQWARRCAAEGYLNQYDRMQPQQPGDRDRLEYPPLQLGVLALWGKWSLTHFPQVKSWHEHPSFALAEPMLRFNLLMEIAALINAFFLTRFWAIARRSQELSCVTPPTFFGGWAPSLSAVLLLWFNPAVVLDGYGWPASDLWVMPPFLLAAWLASTQRWFTAGVIVGIGAMLKTQQLLSIPLFVIWSLVLLRPIFTARFLTGAMIAIAVIVSPWLLTYIPAEALAHAREIQSEFTQVGQAPVGTFRLPRSLDIPALMWVLGVLGSATLQPWVGWLTMKGERSDPSRWRRIFASPWAWRSIAASAAFAAVVWPWLLPGNRDSWMVGVPAGCLLSCMVLLIRPRGIPALAAGATGLALLLCMLTFHGSGAWCDCGWRLQPGISKSMTSGMTDNLPAILVSDFNWPSNGLDLPTVTLRGRVITTEVFLQFLMWLTFILCCVGVGLHARRQDPRFLIALTAPWLMYFCSKPQVPEHSLLFAASISCICCGESVGITLLGLFLTVVTFMMTLHQMLVLSATGGGLRAVGRDLSHHFPRFFKPESGYKLMEFLNGTHPDLGYAVVLCGLVFLYLSLTAIQKENLI